jgi:hypothetical protein
MKLRDPQEHAPRPSTERGAGNDSSNAGEDLRTEASALLAAADRAIDRALSQNSVEFLMQTRQV